MEKLLTPKEAGEILGVCTKTIQRWDKQGKIRCIRTPNNRRRIPESEILRILGEVAAPTPGVEIKPAVEHEPPLKEAPPKVKKPRKPAPVAELPRHKILDALAPTGLAQRAAFGDLLSAAIVLRSFTLEQLIARTRCPEAVAEAFCERMSARGYLVSKNEEFELRVRLAR
jgi:excisionase family DNA binding protein